MNEWFKLLVQNPHVAVRVQVVHESAPLEFPWRWSFLKSIIVPTIISLGLAKEVKRENMDMAGGSGEADSPARQVATSGAPVNTTGSSDEMSWWVCVAKCRSGIGVGGTGWRGSGQTFTSHASLFAFLERDRWCFRRVPFRQPYQVGSKAERSKRAERERSLRRRTRPLALVLCYARRARTFVWEGRHFHGR